MISPLISWPEIAAGNPRFRRMYRSVPMISTEEISLPKDRRCLRFKCNSFYELNAVNTSRVHDLSAVNDCILRFKYSSTTTYDHISFVPEVLAVAPRPIAGELISSWLLRVSFANGLTLAQLVQGIEARFPEVPLRRAFVDDQLSPSARYALAKFLRVTEKNVKALELGQQFPILPSEWI